MNAKLSARFRPMAPKPTFTGVPVSPCAKKAGTSTFSSTKAGSPSA